MCKIAILYICTGAYDIFWKDFFKSSKKYLFTKCKKDYYVFTDAQILYGEDKEDSIYKIWQENLGWPKNTLMRFEMFNRIKDKLKDYDYIFFFNANLEFKDFIQEDILPIKEKLVVVEHPGYFNKDRKVFPYENNSKSLAYIDKNEGKIYVAGGINGGKAEAYIKLIEQLNSNIQKDLSNNIIAVWHDESHLNRYVIGRDDVKILSPEYLYPEGWQIPFAVKILVRDKARWGGVNRLRGIRKRTIWGKIKNTIKRIIK